MEAKQKQYDCRIVMETELLNFCYYKFPQDPVQSDICLVRVKPVEGYRF